MSEFSLMLFTTDVPVVRRAVAAGVDTIVVDWERIGKRLRQEHADTQIGSDTLDDLRRVRECTDAAVVCRVNGFGPWTARDVEDAVSGGADEILLPMVRSVEDVRATLELVRGRCRLAILVETLGAVALARELSRLPLSRVYVGLNDLAIERRTPSLFSAVADGTLSAVRRDVDLPFGFGGLTVPDRGNPIPCRLLIGEMARLGCSFSFLRRSFHADVRGRELGPAVADIRGAVSAARARSSAEVASDRQALLAAIADLERGAARAIRCPT